MLIRKSFAFSPLWLVIFQSAWGLAPSEPWLYPCGAKRPWASYLMSEFSVATSQLSQIYQLKTTQYLPVSGVRRPGTAQRGLLRRVPQRNLRVSAGSFGSSGSPPRPTWLCVELTSLQLWLCCSLSLGLLAVPGGRLQLFAMRPSRCVLTYLTRTCSMFTVIL